MQRLILGLVVLAGLGLYGSGMLDNLLGESGAASVAEDAGGDPTIGFETDDPEMNAAMEEAKTTLPLFITNMTDENGYGAPNAAVKVAFPLGADDAAEVIWVGPFLDHQDGNLVGRLSNQPNYMTGLNAGDQVSFTMDMIRDWSVSGADGMLWGNYTTRVLLPRMDEEMAASLAAVLPDSPVPAEWN